MIKKVMLLLVMACVIMAETINVKSVMKKARSGDEKSMYQLGLMYENGDNVEQNYQKAMYWYKKAARKLQQRDNTPLFKSLKNTQEVKHVTNSKKFFDSHIDKYENDLTNESIFQIISSSFGLLPYKSNYILPVLYDDVKKDGRKQFETKFQISVQKTLTENLFGFNEQIIAAYTQTSWWQTFVSSAPFRETNYQPEIFIIFPSYWSKTALKAYKIGMIQDHGIKSI